MKLTLKHAIVAILLIMSLAATVAADPLQDVFAAHDKPFGLATVPAPQNFYAAHWRELQNDWTVESEMLDRCRAAPSACVATQMRRYIFWL